MIALRAANSPFKIGHYYCSQLSVSDIFINYRRSDVAQVAQRLHAQLRSRFWPSKVFLDVGAIFPGSLWPDRLQTALEKADVILSFIGPGCLTAANEFAQRRLDDPLD